MQTAHALHDPFRVATPSQRLAHAARAERLARMVPVRTLLPAPVATPSQPLPEPVLVSDSMFKAAWDILADPEVAEDDPRGARRPKIDEIQRAAARHFNVTRMDILSIRRTANVIRPRQVAMYLCRELTIRSLPEIGRKFGGRDHTTVLHAVRKIDALIRRDADLAQDVAIIATAIEGAL